MMRSWVDLIRRCIWSQNFQCFRNFENSLGCQTELNKLIYRPNRYTYLCYIYVYVYTRYSHVKPAAKLLQNWPKFMGGNELTATVRRQSTAPFNVKRSERECAFRNWFPNPPTTSSPSFLPPLALQFSVLSLCLCRYWASCLGACKLVFVSGQRRMWHPFASIRQRGL